MAELPGVGIDRETADRKRKGTHTTELDSPVVGSGNGVVDERPVLGRRNGDGSKKEMGRQRANFVKK